MAEIRLTTEQQMVVDAGDCNLLVAAAAGSGKTAVLVRRIIEKILDKEHPQDIDRLLIVTFTNAAAAEMRERIGAAIEEALEAEPENRHLQKQMLLLHHAQITTIHSFCLSVIREFFHVLKIDPGFRIGDEAELSLLRADVFEEVLEECYEGEEEAFVAFAESFAGVGKDAQLTEYGKKLYELAMSQPWPKEWLESLLVQFAFEEKPEDHSMFAGVMEHVKTCLADCELLNQRMLTLTGEMMGPVMYREAFEADRELLAFLRRAESYAGCKALLDNMEFTALSRKKQEASEEKKQLAKDLRNSLKKLLTGLKEDYFYASAEELVEDIRHMEPAMRGLVHLTLRFMERYAEKKKEKNLLDFSDLEHMALKILVTKDADGNVMPTQEARVLAGRFDEIMIDEYQDSNLIQESVLDCISGRWAEKPNVFMVGDVKQSIYRFRMACPDLFMEKYRTYGEQGTYRKIDLHKNFRSRSGILSAINVLFAGLMHADATEVEYDDAAALYYGADYPEETKDYRTELLFVSEEINEHTGMFQEESSEEIREDGNGTEANDAEELSQEEKNKVRAEAMAVAARMKELRRQGFLVGGTGKQHPVNYGDMVILLRTMSGWSEQFAEVLAEQGIPAYADTSAGYFKTFEIRKTLDFLRILDNPKQDIPFAAVLHSPMAGLSAKELAKIRIDYGRLPGEGKKQRSLYVAARMAAEAEPDGKLANFFVMYDRLQEEAGYLSIHELLEHIYQYSGFADVVTVMSGGERRRGNLEMLVAKAKQYESTSFSGLYDFIRYMDKLIKYEVDFGEAQSGESGNMVRIMSIHKSKGLEFPVVFLCGMEKKMNRQDMRKRLILHPELGVGPDFVDYEMRVKAPTLLKKMIAAKMNEEMVSEELRVLYVAMTRAKEKLIMVGTPRDVEKRMATWKERAETVSNHGLLNTYMMKADTYFDFICPLIFAGEKESDGSYRVIRTGNKEVFKGTFSCEICSNLERYGESIQTQLDREEKLRTLAILKEAEPEGSGEALEVRELLRRQTEFSYAFEQEAKLPVKVTVSELKRLHLEAEEEEAAVENMIQKQTDSERSDSYPEFLQPEKEISGSDRGTLYHHVMELLPMERDLSKDDITAFLDGLVAAGKMTAEERGAIFDWKIYKFTQSELGRKMHLAKQNGTLHTEQPFVIGIPANEVYPESESRELILVQGIMDAFFEEEDGIVLMDYKTDYIQEDAKTELAGKYKVQLDYYRRALERLKGKQVKEVWIYSFYAGEGFRLD